MSVVGVLGHQLGQILLLFVVFGMASVLVETNTVL